jgi:predicted nucleic acid-binding protein
MIFVDTSFFVGLLLAKDPHHAEAVELANRHAAAGWLTTNHVVGESWTYLRRRAGHGAAVALLDAVDASPRIHAIHSSAEDESDAATWLRRHDEREYSFVDATSFATMRRERITSALAFDGDFGAAGFVELRA